MSSFQAFYETYRFSRNLISKIQTPGYHDGGRPSLHRFSSNRRRVSIGHPVVNRVHASFVKELPHSLAFHGRNTLWYVEQPVSVTAERPQCLLQDV